jgi:hypothetical protein
MVVPPVLVVVTGIEHADLGDSVDRWTRSVSDVSRT